MGGRIRREDPELTVTVAGFADTSGNFDYNMVLSERRAQKVHDYLVEQGISRQRITVLGFGEGRLPVATADGTADARNRVVQITIE